MHHILIWSLLGISWHLSFWHLTGKCESLRGSLNQICRKQSHFYVRIRFLESLIKGSRVNSLFLPVTRWEVVNDDALDVPLPSMYSTVLYSLFSPRGTAWTAVQYSMWTVDTVFLWFLRGSHIFSEQFIPKETGRLFLPVIEVGGLNEFTLHTCSIKVARV